MSINLIFSIVYITSIVSAQFGGKGKGAETDGGVLVLTDKNFLMEGLDRPWFLVEFYAPWCQHCQKMEPLYSDAAKMLQMHSPMLHIGKVNADANPMLKEQYGVQSFPTFIVFRNGNYLEQYSGPQNPKGIYNAVVKGNHGEDQETDCKTIAKMKKKQKENYHAVYFGPKDHPFYEGIYKPFFDYIQDDPQGHKVKLGVRWNNDPKCAVEMQVGFPSIMWYKKFDEKLNEYTADQTPTLEAFQTWYFFHLAPFPFKLTDYADVTIASGSPIMLLFRSEGQKDEDYAAEFEIAAIESFEKKEQIFYAYTSLDEDYPEKLAKHFDFERAQLPQIRIHAMGQKYKPEKFSSMNATSPLIKEWLGDTMQGQSQPYARVQREPKYNDGAVKILNTNTLYEFLETPGTQKIVCFYEPLIGDRMEVYLRPIIWELAEIYRDSNLTGEGKIQFGEFNRLENENDQFLSKGNVDFFFFSDDFKTLRNYSEDIKSPSLARADIKNWFEEVSYHLSGKPKPEETPQEETKEETKEAEKVEEGVKAEL